VAEVLQSHGVKFVFTLVGGHISPILVAAEALGIQIVDTRHEVSYQFSFFHTVVLCHAVFVCISIQS
jgi:acetolactate synthase-like protein